MNTGKMTQPELLTTDLIAPCGMNCGLCIGHLREKKQCPGCNGDDASKPKHCVVCRIRTCDELTANEQRFCFVCDSFPCTRLRQLDKRYRTKYGMSMIENLETIRDIGLDEFVAREKKRWTCPECGGLICVHKASCLACGYIWNEASGGAG